MTQGRRGARNADRLGLVFQQTQDNSEALLLKLHPVLAKLVQDVEADPALQRSIALAESRGRREDLGGATPLQLEDRVPGPLLGLVLLVGRSSRERTRQRDL